MNTTNEDTGATEAADAPAAKERAAVRDRIKERMAREGLTARALAREVGLVQPLLARFMSNKSRSEAEDSAAATRLAAWLEVTRDVEAARSRASFVMTPTAKRITATLSFARRTGDMACVYGGPGVGKTRTIRNFQDVDPDVVWIATMTPASSGLVSALEVVAEAVGVVDASGGARRMASSIRRQVLGRGGIIIIDEAQHLSLGAIEELRSIHDAAEVALALVGNETSYARLTGGNRSASYAQLFSRLGARLFVQKPEPADVEAVVRHMGVRDTSAIAFLQRIAARPGALRGAVKLVKAVTHACRSDKEIATAVTEKALRDACRSLGAEV